MTHDAARRHDHDATAGVTTVYVTTQQEYEHAGDWLAAHGPGQLCPSAHLENGAAAQLMPDSSGSAPAGSWSWRSGSGLRSALAFRRLDDFAAIEIAPSLANDGAADSPIVTDWQSIDVLFAAPAGGWSDVRYARGALSTPADFEPVIEPLTATGIDLEPGGGRSSSEYLPYASFRGRDGGGLLIGLGWSGQWRLRACPDEAGSLRVRAGLADTHFLLHPGESVTGPSVTLLFHDGDDERAANLWRALVRDHYSPAGARKRSVRVCAATWGATPTHVHMALIDQINREKLPFDTYWVDAAWYGRDDVWWRNVGTWESRPDTHPNGLAPIGAAVRDAGMRFALWFEPERACADSALASEHPDWMLGLPAGKRIMNIHDRSDPDFAFRESRHNDFAGGDLLLNLGNPAARQWLTDFLVHRLLIWHVDVYRQDFNFAPLDFWQANDAVDRRGITEIRHVEGLYAFWDELSARVPGLIIDNCASGGRRMDLAAMRRTVVHSRSDLVTNNEATQRHSAGVSLWLPYHGHIAHAGFSPYALDSALTPTTVVSWAINFNMPELSAFPDEFNFAAIRDHLHAHDQVRDLLTADFHDLSFDAPAGWLIHQYRDHDSGLLLAYRHDGAAVPAATVTPRLAAGEHVATFRTINATSDSHVPVLSAPRTAVTIELSSAASVAISFDIAQH